MNKKSFGIDCAGYSVAADWYEGESIDRVILVLIGWTSSKSRHGDLLESICSSTGSSALVFDYSGHGESEFGVLETRPAQHFLEVISVFDWVKETYPNAKITVMGTSYGGFMATQLTKYREFEQLVLRAPAIYRPEDFYTLAKYRLTSDETDKYRWNGEALSTSPLLARASQFQGKTFVVVHERDETCHKPSTDAYVSAFNAESWVAPKAPHSIKHMDEDFVKLYQAKIAEWISSN